MSIKRKGSFGFDKMQKQMDRLKNDLPVILANEAQNHFLEGFEKNGGQTDASAGGWRPRRPARSRKARQRNKGRNILVESGDLRADIKRRYTSFRRTVVGTKNIPYAAIHNEGLQGRAYGKYNFRMPKREYIGKSRKLDKKSTFTINRELNKIKP